MNDLIEDESFEIWEEHKKLRIKFLSTQLDINTLIREENVIFSDFVQGDVGNCGLIAAFAALSQRTEFLKEIAPTIYSTRDGIKLQFNMFCEGEPITVIIDDTLPFEENKYLVYADSERTDNLYLSSFFEKVFVKQACNYSYERTISTEPCFAFSCFSDCMICFIRYKKEETKQTVMDYISNEVDNKSSVVLGIFPELKENPDADVETGHCYTVMDYNHEYKAIKLYDPRCDPKLCVSNDNFPVSLTSNTDENKGELWVSMDQLEKRRLNIRALHSKNRYKSVLQNKIRISLSDLDRNSLQSLDACKVIVKQKSTFMINFFSYSHKLYDFEFFVTAVDNNKRFVEPDYELPCRHWSDWRFQKGYPKTEYFQKFKLQPNTYLFSVNFKLSNDDLNEEEVNFLMKVASNSEFRFEDLHSKAKQTKTCSIL